MDFRLRRDTQEWFKNISGQKPMETMFDQYYLCLMLGLASGRTSPPTKRCPDCSDLVDAFVSAYRPYQRLIIGLLLIAELGMYGISVAEKEDVQRILLELVDPNTPTNLTDKGMEKLNEYASGGFDYLSESLESRPYHVEEFLKNYVGVLRDAVSQNDRWQSEIKI